MKTIIFDVMCNERFVMQFSYRWWYGHSEYTHQTFGIYLPDGTPSDDCPFSADDILKDLTHKVSHFHDSIYEDV